ncbi:2-hydroxychromene-2-carboxylate isomerase [Klebsiella michiganensis]|uniref:2-hydroxychromene-2-carboxylate isomerase n=1 Tax=Klebsiella michiganensis TaxID=1134687 RepID=UPI0023A9185C|nr:2-hydroxychromene-2-carboxylate isomerase [Klebsiella michiganensis]MDD9640761.1 2-hydroxychromene-2-carboxylate isomerase [Klebsiella michiganensis]
MSTLDFYFDYRSPYSYLALSQVRKMDVEIAFHPLELGDLMVRVGNVPTSLTCEPKGRYVMTDLGRWALHYGVNLNRHPLASEIDASRLLRATLVAGQLGAMSTAVDAIFDAFWSVPAPLSTAADVAALLGTVGFDADELEKRMDTPAAQALLEQATAEAASRGAFGVPTLFVGDEMFFGNDRLNFVQDYLAGAA